MNGNKRYAKIIDILFCLLNFNLFILPLVKLVLFSFVYLWFPAFWCIGWFGLYCFGKLIIRILLYLLWIIVLRLLFSAILFISTNLDCDYYFEKCIWFSYRYCVNLKKKIIWRAYTFWMFSEMYFKEMFHVKHFFLSWSRCYKYICCPIWFYTLISNIDK